MEQTAQRQKQLSPLHADLFESHSESVRVPSQGTDEMLNSKNRGKEHKRKGKNLTPYYLFIKTSYYILEYS